MNLCQYSNILGKPKEGMHSYRVFDIAIFDVIFTLIGAYLIQMIMNTFFGWETNYFIYLLGLFVFSIVCHRLFCVKTKIDGLLFNE